MMTDHESNKRDWLDLASKEMKGKDPKSLEWHTPENIIVKPVYTGDGQSALFRLFHFDLGLDTYRYFMAHPGCSDQYVESWIRTFLILQ